MRIYHWIDFCFNKYYSLRKKVDNLVTCKIVYNDYKLKGTIKSTFINGKRFIYDEPITYAELKKKLLKTNKNNG